MTTLLAMTAALWAAQWLCGRRVRHEAARLKPADEWDGEDVDRWLARIRPFPLPRPTHDRKL